MQLSIEVHRDPRYFLNRGAEELGFMKVSLDVAAFFLAQNLGPCMWTVTARLGSAVVGFLRLSKTQRGSQALGTFVHPDFRRRGIGTAMWRHAQQELGLQHVDVVATTTSGQRFFEALAHDTELADLFIDDDI